MTDDLRLRTARALGWVNVHREQRSDGTALICFERDGHTKWLTCASDGTIIEVLSDLPAYGTSWASCEEIDAAIRQRGWQWESQIIHDEIGVMIYKGLLNATIATAPTFPAALALAFCQAVEAKHD